MFVHDVPPAVNFTQTHGQPKFERFMLAARIDASKTQLRLFGD